jgi:hypothetical protein
MVVLGDSHAEALLPAFAQLGSARHEAVYSWAKAGCPINDTPMWHVEARNMRTDCVPWRSKVLSLVRGLGHVDSIFLVRWGLEADRVRTTSGQPLSRRAADAAWSNSTAALLTELAPLATHVFIVADVPTAPDNIPRCVSTHLDDPAQCNFARATSAHPDARLLRDEAAPARAAGVRFVDLTPFLCTATTCPGVTTDGVIVYMDSMHLTRTFSATLWRLLARALASSSSDPPLS